MRRAPIRPPCAESCERRKQPSAVSRESTALCTDTKTHKNLQNDFEGGNDSMTKTNTRSRIVSILLVLMMLLTMVPITAVTANAADGFKEVKTYEELKAAVDKGEAKVKLVANIDTTNENGGAGVTNQTALTFFGNNNILDLNGHTLKLVSNTGTTFINVNKDLTIQDSGTGGRIDFVYGPSVMHRTTAIYVSHASNEDIAHLTVKSGTLSSTKGGITLIESIGNLTINGGKFYAPYEVGTGGTYAIHTIHQYNDNAKTIITGGEIDGVVFIQRTDSAATGTPNYGDIPVQIKGGTFKQHMQLRWTEKGEPSGYPTEFSPAVEIAGGIFEKRINPMENGVWGRDLSTKLTGGTFKDYTSLGLGKGDSTGTDYKYYLKSLGNSIIMRGNEIRTSCDWSEADWFNVNVGSIYGSISLDGSESNPVIVIPNAWGMKSVTLDGTKINYAKDWNGAVEKITNDTAHTIKFEWKDLAPELSAAGYSYRTNFDCYTVGSNTPTTSVPISATATEYSHTIPAGEAPSVYPFDLQLNLDKNGSSVGIVVNQHIVKLVVDEAPPAPPAPVAHSITITNTHGTATPATAIAGETVTVKADDRTGYSQMFTQWYTKTAGVTFADVTKQETTFVMPDRDVQVYPGYQQVSFTKQPIDSWPQVNHAGKAYVTFSAPITKWELKEGNTTVASSGNLFINTGNPITVDIPAQSSEVEKTYTVVVTANGQKFSSNEFKVKWVSWPQAPAVEFTPADGTQFVGEIDVTVSDALYAGEEIFEIAYTTDGTDPKTSTTTRYANTDTEHITLTETTTIKARTYNHDASADAEKWGPLATATFTKYSDTTLPKPTITPEGTTYTGSITAYLTAPALDGVKMEYCLMRTGDPDIPDRWETYDPETGITVNDFGSITLYARSFKDVDAETPDGLYYVEHLTSENATATYTRTYSAAIDNVTVSGKVGKTMTQDVVIRMNGDRFENITAGDDVSAWFNLPAGLTAKVKELSDANGYHRTLTVTISGMPTATSAAAITVTIPKDKLYANNTTDLTVLSNPNAYYSIALDADHQHDYSGQPYLYLDPGNHYQECKAGDGYNIQAHEFTPWTDNGNGTHSRHCTVCKMTDGSTYTETAEHTWVWVVDQEAALGQPGKQHEECTGCHAKRSENTEIPALRDYAVTVTGGTATVAAGTPITRAMEGVEVTVTAQVPDGKHFVKWVVKAGGVTLANETSATTTFIMPANDVTIEAECAENPVESYTLTVIKGTASVAAGTPITDKVEQNTVVTVTADAPETGKVFDKWVVLEGNVTLADATKAATTFTMPASAVKIEATYKDAPPAHTHSYGTDWKYDDTNHWHECECGDKADTAAHNFQWVIDKAATKEATGIKHEECTVCGAKRSENTVIDKLPDGGNTGNTGSGDNNTDKPGKDDSTKAPQTGDSSNLIGWLAALFVSGGVLTLLGVSGKKRKESEVE